VIAVDTNLLVYAHRADSAEHERAYAVVRELAEGVARWAIPWPCAHEFLAIVTHPRIYRPASTIEQALEQVRAWAESPSLTWLAESDEVYWPVLERLLRESRAEGPRVHDARVAALCVSHGVTELLTADRDFGRFPQLRTRNPLVAT
jgi:toxin-antitoxin system PIN domain toxin